MYRTELLKINSHLMQTTCFCGISGKSTHLFNSNSQQISGEMHPMSINERYQKQFHGLKFKHLHAVVQESSPLQCGNFPSPIWLICQGFFVFEKKFFKLYQLLAAFNFIQDLLNIISPFCFLSKTHMYPINPPPIEESNSLNCTAT